MGVESHAILERWHAEPEYRPFDDWSQLIVITAQVGEEHKQDTIRLMEERALPLLREHGVRFVEVARRGHLEEDGIVVLQDTREPYKLHPEGVYKLSDELLSSGTVPQFGGNHRCAQKFKAFVIETWLAWEFRGHADHPVYHCFGYNADEVSRAQNSDIHIARHNEERRVPVTRTPLEVFGFNSEEVGRIDRSRLYDGPHRIGHYPLQDWGWNRQKCLDYIREKTGLTWVKSHCSFCPFCSEASKGLEGAVARWYAAPEQTAHGLMVEHNSLSFNPRGHLYRDIAMIDVIRARNVVPVIEAFERRLNTMEWGFYKVRRIYTAKGKAIRCVELLLIGTRAGMESHLDERVGEEFRDAVLTQRGIRYAMFERRVPDTYPTREGFYVAAPRFMATKLRGPIEKFNERWEKVGRGEPLRPIKESKEL